MYVWQAELWCDDCGALIAETPGMIDTGDSDDFPQHAEPGETDSPNHCPSGADCPNRIDLAEYGCPTDTPRGLRYIGELLETELTPDGRAYVAEMLAEKDPSPRNVALHAYWREAFDIAPDPFADIRDDAGRLPAHAWPGGYPILYVVDDAETLCPRCANGDDGSEAHIGGDADGWRLEGFQIHYEGPPATCAHCGAETPSAYGDPDDDAPVGSEPEPEPRPPFDFGPAYRADGYSDGIAWRAYAYETAPDAETEWSGYERETGRILAHMIGDDRAHSFDPEELTPIEPGAYCLDCGQIGCAWHTDPDA